jgi:hypothetical protein
VNDSTCFECDEPAEHHHHVVPVVAGGTRTVPLCARCHGLVHGINYGTNHIGATIAGIANARARGVTLGAPRLLARPAMAAAVERARALRASGLSLRDVVAALNAEGVASAKGGVWHVKTLRAALAVGEATVTEA